MKIATWNVNGIRAREEQVRQWIGEHRPDVVCLQEIKATPEQVPTLLWEMDGYWCYWHGARAYSGVGLHVSKALAPERPVITHPPFDFENRIAAVEIGGVTVASVYVPNGGKDLPAKMRFLDELTEYAAVCRQAGRPLVICGDLNVARADIDVHPKERKPLAIGQLPQEREAFGRLLGQGLVDVARTLEPTNDALFTWWAPWRNLRQRNIGWRIDYVLASEAMAARVVHCASMREVGTSDHAPVVATFGA